MPNNLNQNRNLSFFTLFLINLLYFISFTCNSSTFRLAPNEFI